MEIVTGSTGQVHVTPIDDAVRNGNPGYLKKKIVIDYLDKFAATIVSNSYVRVSSGYGMNQGRIFKINNGDYDNVPIENGAQGYKRADLIVARYSMDVQTGFESMELVAIKGAAGSTYVDPAYMTGDINGNIISSEFHDDFPLYRVRINGTTLEGLDRLFTPVPDGGRLGELEAKYENHMKYFNKVNIRTNLSTENAPLLKNGGETGNIRPGVEGTLPVLHGGTGQTTLKAAGDSIIGNLGDNNTAPTDTTVFIGSTPNTSGFQKKTMASLWTYLTGKIRTLLGMGTNNVVPISHGGTGKTSITNNNVLVGNAGGGFDEWGIDTAPSSANAKKLITSKGVADALGNAGYGDMMKSTYDPNNDGIIAIAQGGTGANTVAGARNALKLGNTDGPVPVANGGTGLAASPSMLTNLGSTTAAAVLQASPRPGITGTLPVTHGGTGQTSTKGIRNSIGIGGEVSDAVPVANGGTGLKASPSLLVNLGSTSASNILQASPRPGITGTLPVANGGTGATSASAARTNLGAMSSGGGTFKGNVAVVTGGTIGRLTLGNSTQTSAPDETGSTGSLRIYGQYSYHADLYTNSSMSSNQNYYLPKSGGTLITNQALEVGVGGGGSYRLTAGGAGVQGDVQIWSPNSFTGTFKEDLETLKKNRVYSMPNSTGIIQVSSSSSRRVKENIHDMTEERAKKLLDLDIVNFDYIGDFGGGLKDQSGVIAEDAVKVIPEAVLIPKKYDETKPVDEEINPAPSVDYRQYIPYLIKMVQMQQKEIEELKKR